MGSLDGGESALRLDEGLFFSSLQDDYCLPVPSHTPEYERLECTHAVYTQMIGNLPEEVMNYLEEDGEIGQKYVLDVGCGTGRWAFEVALQHPNVNVIGLDLVHAPIPNVPHNLAFEVHDILYGLGYPDETFDVVHVRDIGLGIRNYPAFITKCTRVLKPGGYLVLLETEYYIHALNSDQSHEYSSPGMWGQALQAALYERQLDPLLGQKIEGHVSRIPGLEPGVFQRFAVPLTARHSDPALSYLGELTTQIWAWFGQSARLLLQDHGPYDSQELAMESINEAEEEAELYWFFDTGLVRKA